MEPAVSLRFAHTVRMLGSASRGLGLRLPSFRSPPRVAGAARTLRRRGDGSAIVAVQLHGRPWEAVVADLVEGVVVANELVGTEADRCRQALWAAVSEEPSQKAA